jgi:hypothetical protein
MAREEEEKKNECKYPKPQKKQKLILLFNQVPVVWAG